MTILSVSVSHHSAGIDQLARLAMSRDTCTALARQLVADDVVTEAMVLSTCNRTEVYVDTTRFHAGLDAVIDALAQHTGVPGSELPALCAVRYDDAAVGHAFAMTAGLDSLVVGEAQVLGQVRLALSDAQSAGVSGPVLNAMAQSALRVGKRVHSETRVGAAGRSVFSAALDELASLGVDVSGRRVLVVGAGAMSGLAARSLATLGASVTCVNRTFSSAQRLALEVSGRAVPFDQLGGELGHHEVVVTCTGAAGTLIDAEMLPAEPPRAIVDLALPPDVDSSVRDRGVTLVNLASLAERLHDEQVDLDAARALVREEQQRFLARQRAQAVTPAVVALRHKAEEIVEAEFTRLERRLPGLPDAARAELLKSLHRVADKLLHSPTVRAQQGARDDDDVDYAAVLRTLFSLDEAS